MDTREVAEYLGTTPRIFRAFLRSPKSTFVSVGSGARYSFTQRDLPTLLKRFEEWKADGKPKPNVTPRERPSMKPKRDTPSETDLHVWEEEGPILLEDIRDPAVRAKVQARARADEDRLMIQLLSAGLHITQLGDRRAS